MEKSKKYYQDIIKNCEAKEPVVKNAFQAFAFGGFICLFGQGLLTFYSQVCQFEEMEAKSMMYLTLIFIASLLSGLGVYDKIGQIAKAGSLVPITGFANSVTSSAIEGKSEGIFLGISVGTLKLAGSVITFGVVSATIVGIIRFIGGWI